MSRRLQLDSGLPEFKPVSRHAVLLNNYDRVELFNPPYTHPDPSRGNRRVYEVEALLQGRFSQGPNQWRAMSNLYLPKVYQYEMDIHRSSGRSPYNSATRILQKTQMCRKLKRTLKKISDSSTDGTLTFVYITSHGEAGSFSIDGNKSMRYEDLLNRLDKIRGKKVVVLLACYSGSLIDELEPRTGKSDYIVLTSAPRDEEGVNWGEDKIHDIITRNISGRGKMSDITLPPDSNDTHPQIWGAYDVRL